MIRSKQVLPLRYTVVSKWGLGKSWDSDYFNIIAKVIVVFVAIITL